MHPRSQPVKFGVPYDYDTGQVLTDGQVERIQRLREAHQALRNVMHECEGTDPGNAEFSSRSMRKADEQLELSMLMAKKAALEAN